MTQKTIFRFLLGMILIGFSSCSNNVNTDTSTQLSPDVVAKRTLKVTTQSSTRSIVSIKDGNKWEAGDRFIAYNISHPNGFDMVSATNNGKSSSLEGTVECQQGDQIALFYPFRYNDRSVPKGCVKIGLIENTVVEGGNFVTKKQNGTETNLKYFDYSWGLIDHIAVKGDAASGSTQLEKQYAILHLNFIYNNKPLKNITKLTIDGIPNEAIFDLTTGIYNYPNREGFTILLPTPQEVIDVAVFPDTSFRPTFTVETADGEQYTLTLKSGKNVEKAKYYPVTIDLTTVPWIDIDGIKWSKYNLQYTPGDQRDGWQCGYHLAKNAWDYFYTEVDGTKPIGTIELPSCLDNAKFDHFRWGDIANAYKYGHNNMDSYSLKAGSIQGDYDSELKFGDLAYYASKGKWKLPNKCDFDNLMANTGQYLGYYNDGVHTIYGILFDPTVTDNKKGWVLDKNGNAKRKSNTDAGSVDANTFMKKFTKEEIDKGVFFPFAGTYTDYNDGFRFLLNPGNWGMYWTGDGTNATQAQVFAGKYMNHSKQFYYGTTKGVTNKNPKRNMYSIRPILVN